MYKKDRFACPFLFVHNPCQNSLPPSDEGGARRAEGENFLSDVIYHTSLPYYFTIRTTNVGEGLRALPRAGKPCPYVIFGSGKRLPYKACADGKERFFAFAQNDKLLLIFCLNL